MKKLSLVVVLVILSAASAFAHQGSIGLYMSTAGTDCDYGPALFEQFDFQILYVRSDSGPNGIRALEFKIEKSSGIINFISTTWRPGFITLGDIESGVSASANDCYGAGLAFAPVATVRMFTTSGDPAVLANEYIRVVPDPGALEPGIWVATCVPPYPLHEVLGGWFKFVNNSCNTAVEPVSWGAIKALLDQ